jgi:hypothetical protein
MQNLPFWLKMAQFLDTEVEGNEEKPRKSIMFPPIAHSLLLAIVFY